MWRSDLIIYCENSIIFNGYIDLKIKFFAWKEHFFCCCSILHCKKICSFYRKKIYFKEIICIFYELSVILIDFVPNFVLNTSYFRKINSFLLSSTLQFYFYKINYFLQCIKVKRHKTTIKNKNKKRIYLISLVLH